MKHSYVIEIVIVFVPQYISEGENCTNIKLDSCECSCVCTNFNSNDKLICNEFNFSTCS